MHDLESMREMNAPRSGQGNVSSDGRVCTDYYSHPTRKRFYVDISTCSVSEGCVADTIAYPQGHITFGPMPYGDALRLCDLLNTLTMV